MVDARRQYGVRPKRRVIIDKRFPMVKSLEMGDKGIMRVSLSVEGQHLEPDDGGNDMKIVLVKINKAELIDTMKVKDF